MNKGRVVISAIDCTESETRPANNAAMGSLSEMPSEKQKDEDDFPRSAKKVNGHWVCVEVRKGTMLPLYEENGQTVVDGGIERKQMEQL